MARLIRMDKTGHTTLAEWTSDDPASVESAVAAFRQQLDEGYYAIVTRGEGHAEQVRELPPDADTVNRRRPIAGVCWRAARPGTRRPPGDGQRLLAAPGRRTAPE